MASDPHIPRFRTVLVIKAGRVLLPLGLAALLIILAVGCSKEHPRGFVLDSEHVLTPAQHQSLDSLFRAHEARTGNEIALVTHPTFNGRSAKDFAIAFGDSVGVGKKGSDNGLVIAFSNARHEVLIATGKGTERVLHDSICQRIVDHDMLPRFSENDLFGGLLAGSRSVVEFLDRPENRILAERPLRSSPPMQDPIIRRFRSVAIAEGVSFIVLLGFAMPLKYIWHYPMPVKVVGWAHGVLFIWYWIAAIPLFTRLKWNADRIVGLGLASVLPFGTFVMERKWLR